MPTSHQDQHLEHLLLHALPQIIKSAAIPIHHPAAGRARRWPPRGATAVQLISFCEVDPLYPFYLRKLDLRTLSQRDKKPSGRKRALEQESVIELSDSLAIQTDGSGKADGSSLLRAINSA